MSGRKIIVPTGNERFFEEDEVIVSKTDYKGIITYANDVFIKVSGYREEELIGKPHNLIRHPDMPKGAFAYVWSRIKAGEEVFAYVVNMAKNGDHYWVLAHLTPSFDDKGMITAFHSNRRVPGRKAVDTLKGVYKLMLEEEAKYQNPNQAKDASIALLVDILQKSKVTYDQFIFSLQS